MLRKWNVTLVVGTFLLSVLGTFITRSGVIQSVHSFAQSPVGTWFATFMVLAIVATSILVSQRLQDLEAKAQLEAMISREAAFLYNNLVLVGIAFSVLWGTLFPILSEAVRGSKITVGESFFKRGERAARPAPPRAHRHRAAHRVAQGERAQHPAAVRGPRGLRPARRRGADGARDAEVLSPRLVHPRRLRRRHDHPGVLEGRRGASPDVWREPGRRARSPRRAQPPPLRRLRGARRHRDHVRRVRRHGVQEGVRRLARRRRELQGRRPLWARLDVHERRALVGQAAQSRGRDGRAPPPRSTASASTSSRARSASTSIRAATRRSSRPPRSASSSTTTRTCISSSRAS
jgi:hypothetical protein